MMNFFDCFYKRKREREREREREPHSLEFEKRDGKIDREIKRKRGKRKNGRERRIQRKHMK